jgi:hypothetical protein
MSMTAERIAALTAALPALDASSRTFAESLLRQYAQRGNLSVRQWPHVERLCERAQRPAAATPATTGGVALPEPNADALRARLAAAAAHGLLRPMIRVGQMRLSLPGPTSQYAGRPVVFVRNAGTYAGRIEAGRFIAARGAEPTDTRYTVAALTNVLIGDVVNNLAAIGRQTGSCCFCGRELTDARSVTVGYGPICAGHYGLPWGESESADPSDAAEAADAAMTEEQVRDAASAARLAARERERNARRSTTGLSPDAARAAIAALDSFAVIVDGGPLRRATTSRPRLPAACANSAPVAPDQPDDEDRMFMGGA